MIYRNEQSALWLNMSSSTGFCEHYNVVWRTISVLSENAAISGIQLSEAHCLTRLVNKIYNVALGPIFD